MFKSGIGRKKNFFVENLGFGVRVNIKDIGFVVSMNLDVVRFKIYIIIIWLLGVRIWIKIKDFVSLCCWILLWKLFWNVSLIGLRNF